VPLALTATGATAHCQYSVPIMMAQLNPYVLCRPLGSLRFAPSHSTTNQFGLRVLSDGKILEVGPKVWRKVREKRRHQLAVRRTMRMISRRFTESSLRSTVVVEKASSGNLRCHPSSHPCRGAACSCHPLRLRARDARHQEMYSGLLNRYLTSGHPPILISLVVNNELPEFRLSTKSV